MICVLNAPYVQKYTMSALILNVSFAILYIFQIESTGGCKAEPDESGTEMVGVDNLGRRSAVSFNDTTKPTWYLFRVKNI